MRARDSKWKGLDMIGSGERQEVDFQILMSPLFVFFSA